MGIGMCVNQMLTAQQTRTSIIGHKTNLGNVGGVWVWEAAAGPGLMDPFREDWPHWDSWVLPDIDRV